MTVEPEAFGARGAPQWRCRVLAGLLASAAVAHFLQSGTFAGIVPRLLPGSGRFWTLLSGASELALAAGVWWRRSRRIAAALSALFFILVFPANVQMAVDWAHRSAWELAIALLRLPLQIPLIWLAWTVRSDANREDVVAVIR